MRKHVLEKEGFSEKTTFLQPGQETGVRAVKKTGRNAPDRGNYRYKGPGVGQDSTPGPVQRRRCSQIAQPGKEAMWIVGKEGSGNGRKPQVWPSQKPEGNVSQRES